MKESRERVESLDPKSFDLAYYNPGHVSDVFPAIEWEMVACRKALRNTGVMVVESDMRGHPILRRQMDRVFMVQGFVADIVAAPRGRSDLNDHAHRHLSVYAADWKAFEGRDWRIRDGLLSEIPFPSVIREDGRGHALALLIEAATNVDGRILGIDIDAHALAGAVKAANGLERGNRVWTWISSQTGVRKDG